MVGLFTIVIFLLTLVLFITGEYLKRNIKVDSTKSVSKIIFYNSFVIAFFFVVNTIISAVLIILN